MSLVSAPDATHPIKVRDFRFFLIVRFCVTIGQFGLLLVIAWQTYSTARLTMGTHAAAAQLGLIGLAQFVPLFFLTPVSGWVADHYDRRKIGALSVTLQLLCTATLGYATCYHLVSLPLLFAIAALLGVTRCFSGPAFSSMVPRLVPPPLVPKAIGISTMIWQTAMIGGPALGGYLYSILPWLPHLLSVSMFCIAIMALLFIKPVLPSQTDKARHPLRQMLDGLVYVRSNRLVLGAITLDLMAVLLAGSTALLPVYVHDIYHASAGTLGKLAAASGVGASLTALIFSIYPPASNVGNKMMSAVAIFGLATIAFGLTAFLPTDVAIPVAFFALFTCGVADMFSVFVRQTLIQIYTPDEMRGRVSSVSQLTISASNELGEAESGFLASLIGPVTAVVGGGIGAILVVILWARLFPEIGLARRFDAVENGDLDSAPAHPQQSASS